MTTDHAANRLSQPKARAGTRTPGSSFTSGTTFEARVLISEMWRFGIMACCFTVLLMLWFLRRTAGGVDAGVDRIMYPTCGILVAAALFNLIGFGVVRASVRRGETRTPWVVPVGVGVDMGVPLACMLVLHLWSPLGALRSLNAPMILVLALVVMLSILRLRPWLSIGLGFASALGHWGLVGATIAGGGGEGHQSEVPRLLSYGVLLAIIGLAAGVIARLSRETIRAAVAEAEKAERTAAELRSVEHELDIARTIQQGLLPKQPPRLERFDVSGMSRPATQTGGDFYDWQPLPDGRVIVAIADVTGHGIGPALVMAVCRAYCRAITPTTQGAEQYLDSINELISRDVTSGRFITMAVVIASPSGAVDLLSAGHGPTFLWRAGDGSLERFDGQGLPLGIEQSERYTPVQQRTLSPGDMIVLLTDGFMEAQSVRGEQFGIKRLESVIRANAGATSAQMILAIDEAVRTHARGREQDDDMTAVVLRYT